MLTIFQPRGRRRRRVGSHVRRRHGARALSNNRCRTLDAHRARSPRSCLDRADGGSGRLARVVSKRRPPCGAPGSCAAAPQQRRVVILSSLRHGSVSFTGGARGITAEIATALAALHRSHFILVGRSPYRRSEEPAETMGIAAGTALKAALLDQMRRDGAMAALADLDTAHARIVSQRAIRQTMHRIAQVGGRATYRSVDVRDVDAFASLIRGIYDEFGRIDAVIHGAGVIEDKLCRDKTAASFDRVFDTKAASAFVLARELRSDTLKCLVFFSSVAGAFGSRGQCDYTAANALLNGFAAHLDARWPGRVTAIGTGGRGRERGWSRRKCGVSSSTVGSSSCR